MATSSLGPKMLYVRGLALVAILATAAVLLWVPSLQADATLWSDAAELSSQGRHDEAIARLEIIASRDNLHYHRGYPPQLAVAVSLRAQGRLGEALALLEGLEPGGDDEVLGPALQLAIAETLVQLGRPGDALARLDAAVRRWAPLSDQPRFILRAHAQRVAALQALGRDADAVDRAFRGGEDPYRAALAEAAWRMGDPELLRRVIDGSDGNAAEQLGWAQLQQARRQLEKGELEGARDRCAQAAQAHSQQRQLFAELRLCAAQAQCELGAFAECRAGLEAIASMVPEGIPSWVFYEARKGLIVYFAMREGRRAEAAEAFEALRSQHGGESEHSADIDAMLRELRR